jgi:hypothetical protein
MLVIVRVELAKTQRDRREPNHRLSGCSGHIDVAPITLISPRQQRLSLMRPQIRHHLWRIHQAEQAG